MKIRIDHIAKTEGHLSFEGALFNGDIARAKIITLEGARLIEGLLVNRPYYEAPILTSRICGICPIVHMLTAIKAIEKAMGIKIPEHIRILRKILENVQVIHSHALHLFFLSGPDFLNYSNDLKFIKKYPKETAAAVRIRDFVLELAQIIGTRAVHNLTPQVGGFKKLPAKKQLEKIFSEVPQAINNAKLLIDFFAKLTYPSFERKTNFACLSDKKNYQIYDGDISLNKKIIPLKDFFKYFEEEEFAKQVVKRYKCEGESYMVGAIARINNNFDFLNAESKRAWLKFTKKAVTYNPFYNVAAQAVECLELLLQIEKDLKNLLKKPLNQSSVSYKIKAGEGIGAIEAPRGTLFHYYKIDKNGIIKKCQIVTPTAQFLNNLEDDLKEYLPQTKKVSKKEREQKLKMLIRAYDPCIACATH
jgi:sulfhydrogenase subunit alpha